MTIGVCTVELYLPGTESLKDKRQILKSLKDRARRKFNISIAEVEDQDLWGKSVLGIACVANQRDHVNSVLDKVLEMIKGNPLLELVDYRLEML